LRIGDALKGGTEVVSRVRIAAAACLTVFGLIVGGASGALAFADPALDTLDIADGEGPAQDDGTQSRDDEKPDDEKPDDEKPDGEKPDEGKPDGDKPDEGKPDDKPDGENPDGEEPDGEKPDGEQPGEEPDGEEPTEEPEPGQCEEKSDDDCGPGWPPWWPWPWPDPGLPPDPGGGGGGHSGEVPSGRPDLPPAMQLPPELLPGPEHAEPAVIDAEPGVDVAAPEMALAPITLPIIVAPPGLGAGGGAPRSLPTEPVPGSPRGSAAEPPAGRQPPAGETGSNVSMPPSSYRIGYTDYLRSAGLSQVVALAAPGLAGMLVLTGAGGLVGYRQAKAGHAVHTGRSARFVN
jgi:hypothetical protein